MCDIPYQALSQLVQQWEGPGDEAKTPVYCTEFKVDLCEFSWMFVCSEVKCSQWLWFEEILYSVFSNTEMFNYPVL